MDAVSYPRSAASGRLSGPGNITEVPPSQGNPLELDQVSPFDRPVLAIVGATPEDDGRAGFFGNSSAGSFMRNMKKVVQQKTGGAPRQSSVHRRDTQDLLSAVGHDPEQDKHVEYVLPSRRRADMLMSLYWKYFYVLYPYLDRSQALENYERIWKADGSISDERSYLCLVNVMFALCSQIDDSTPVKDRQKAAHVFYLRARELLDLLGPGSVCSVQTFLLLGQYFQSTNESHLCWTFIGLAIRTAQSLGLHLAGTSAKTSDLSTRELLRKVWHGCILMDRVVSTIYGRPCMIGPEAALNVPLPLPIDEGRFTEAPEVQSGQSYTVEFYVHSLKLYEILHEIMFKLYSVNCQPTRIVEGDNYAPSLDQGQHSLFEIERKLSMWKASIPPRLQVLMGGHAQRDYADTTLYRQAVVLQQRQIHVRLLLLRPLLSNFITYEFSNEDRPVPLEDLLSHRVYLQCAVVCVKLALEMIDRVYREKSSKIGEVGSCAPWWYNVLYLYISATVLIAARLSGAIVADVSEDAILNGWHRAMEILREYSAYGQSIERLGTTLRLMFEAVPQQYSRFRASSRQAQTEVSSTSQDQNQATSSLGLWNPMDLEHSFPTTLDDLTGHGEEGALSNDWLLEFESTFDPNDLSWLTSIPLDID